jgi:hypothetical protein
VNQHIDNDVAEQDDFSVLPDPFEEAPLRVAASQKRVLMPSFASCSTSCFYSYVSLTMVS